MNSFQPRPNHPFTILPFLLAAALSLRADVVPHPLFTDNMVLQRDMPIAIYGKATEDERVTVNLAGQEASTITKNGRWRASLTPLRAGGPHTLTIKGANTITLQNILIGDVWLCTGQSNMAGSLDSYIKYGNGMFQEYKNVPGGYRNANIRLFKCANVGFDAPQTEPATDSAFGPRWRECDPDAAVLFSATGFFFGKALQPAAGVPVGLIYATLGGTPAESWMSPATLRATPDAKPYLDAYEKAVANLPAALEEHKKRIDAWEAKRKAGARAEELGRRPDEPMGPQHIKRPSALYHGVICPLQGFAIKGAIWYQGEGNAGRAKEYRTVFPALIRNWRNDWKQGDFPFLFVQLAAYQKAEQDPTDPPWAHLREAQTLTWKTVPNTGMAVAIDGGLEDNIHPPYKELVGNRLASAARAVAYGESLVYSGPLFKSMRVERDRAVLTFEHAGSGLETREITLNAYGKTPYHLPANELKGFSLCGEDRKFHWAKATISGKDTVELQCDQVPKPVAARYAWASFPLCNLFNKEGFAAGPFRTDDFEQGYAEKVGGVAIGKKHASSHPNPNSAKNGSWDGLTDGSLADDGRATYSTDARMTFPKSVVIDLERPHAIDTVRLFNSANGGTKTVEALISADGATYEPIGKTVFENYTAATFDAKPKEPRIARYVKIIFHDVHDLSFTKKPNGFVFLREVEVLGKPE
ncbi:MAG TPA: sialate O-acetylesterase [Verrucomicrobiae bacterium]|nr:sialate O-acetylesterase [Verrucomicrobiae bacterium]